MMKHRFPRLLFIALCGLAPTALGHLLDWSTWLWVFMSMVTTSGSLLLVVTVLDGGHASAVPYQPGEHEPPTVPTEQPYQEAQVIDAALPSATNGYDFLFSATVRWRPVPGHVGQGDSASSALAVSSVVSRAMKVVRHEDPGRASFARYLLEGQLGVLLPDLSGRVKAMAVDVTLTLAPADRERLQKLNDLRKDEEIWEYERQHERNKRRYLGDDVLQSAGSAVVWWLARHENEIEKAVDMIGPLAQVAAAANDEEVPELFRHLLVPPVGTRNEATVGGPGWVGGHQRGEVLDREDEVGVSDRLRLLLTEAGLKPDMDGYTVLAHRVMRFLQTEGRDEAADEIRRGFGLAPDDGPQDEPSGEGNTTGPWPPRPPAPESPPCTDPDVAPEASTFTSRTAEGSASAGDQGRDRWETGEDVTPPPHFRDQSDSPRRSTEPRPRNKGDENGI